MPVNNDIEIRSDEVQEILGHTPNWMIRWGITLLFILIVMLVFISWFIKYPDVIPGKIILTTEVPPVKLVSKTNGQLQRIYIQEGALVDEGDFIAELENPLSETSIFYLSERVSKVDSFLDMSEPTESVSFYDSSFVFGEIQGEYNQLKSLTNEYYIFKTDSFHLNKMEHLKKQVDYHNQLAAISNRQLSLAKKDLANSKRKFESDKRLYKKGVISKVAFYKEESLVTSSKQQVENLKKTFVQNNITISEYERQLQEMEHELNEKERILKEGIRASINSINNFINSWQQNYVLIAPFKGKVSYLSSVSENQFIQAGTSLFAVIPENNEFIGHMGISAQGFGKIKVGQQVQIKLDNYPSHEYGQLMGVVKEISLIPNMDPSTQQPIYEAKVALINKLQTTYNKVLEFRPEMMGTAEIVTEDLRLMERVFNQFRKIMDK